MAKSYTLVFGLTADPIHKGHEQVILNSFAFAKQHGFNIDQFILIPTYQPNLIANKKQPRTHYKHRFKMCELVAKEMTNQYNYPVQVSDIEKQLFKKTNQKSYSYDTLSAIEANHKLFVVSADHFSGRWPKFRKWYNWEALVKENGLLIHPRPGNKINTNFIEDLRHLNPDVFLLSDLPAVDISSTQLRHAIMCNESISKQLISKPVMQYVNRQHLYEI